MRQWLHAKTPPSPSQAPSCLAHIGDDPIYLLSQRPDDSLANHRHSAWIGGCERCQAELVAVCRHEGFNPRIASLSDDIVVVQSLVALGRLAARHPAHPAARSSGVARDRCRTVKPN